MRDELDTAQAKRAADRAEADLLAATTPARPRARKVAATVADAQTVRHRDDKYGAWRLIVHPVGPEWACEYCHA